MESISAEDSKVIDSLWLKNRPTFENPLDVDKLEWLSMGRTKKVLDVIADTFDRKIWQTTKAPQGKKDEEEPVSEIKIPDFATVSKSCTLKDGEVDWKQFQCTFELERRIVEYEGKKTINTNMPKHLYDTYANLNATEVLSYFLNSEKIEKRKYDFVFCPKQSFSNQERGLQEYDKQE